jgi:hypothetical protein
MFKVSDGLSPAGRLAHRWHKRRLKEKVRSQFSAFLFPSSEKSFFLDYLAAHRALCPTEFVCSQFDYGITSISVGHGAAHT